MTGFTRKCGRAEGGWDCSDPAKVWFVPEGRHRFSSRLSPANPERPVDATFEPIGPMSPAKPLVRIALNRPSPAKFLLNQNRR
jgi:hypothetical protein